MDANKNDPPDSRQITPAPVSRIQLFVGFLKIGLLGFGGVAPVARHVVVEDRAWLSEQDYASLLGVGQILPGANVVNTSIMIGDRFQGVFGSLIALAGLLAMPLGILVLLATLYERFAAVAAVQVAMTGTAAAASGLVIGTALKMAWRLKPGPLAVIIGLAAFIAVVAFHIPLPLAVVILVPLSVLAAYGRRRG